MRSYPRLATLALLAAWQTQALAQSTCASVAGVWTSHENSIFQLFQSASGQITGAMTYSPYCYYGQPWPVTGGTFTGNGNFTFTIQNPFGYDPEAGCVPVSALTGVVLKPGCHTVSGTYTNRFTTNGKFTFSKACDLPSGEQNTGVDWDSSDPTVYIWDATLTPDTINFNGRTISESISTGDGCYFPGSAIPEVTDAPPNPATVQSNGYRDKVGWVSGAVTYYRAQNRAPCSFSSVQRMLIDCLTSTPSFITNGLGGTIGTTTVTSSRAGQTRTRTWP